MEMALAWPFVSRTVYRRRPVHPLGPQSIRNRGLMLARRPIVPAVAQATTLTCPKCGGEMRTYERNGVVVDQCTECRGIFLDRGELERLVDAEGRHYDDSGDRRREDEHRAERPKKSKKRSFLENLFEGE